MVKLACPLEFNETVPARIVPFSSKLTVPWATLDPELVTWAVKVMVAPTNPGLGLAVTAVVVAAAEVVVNARQYPPIVPLSPAAWS